MQATIKDGKLIIKQEGKGKKYVKKVEQVTFSGAYAKKTKQPVLYITERAVFELQNGEVTLIEIAPGDFRAVWDSGTKERPRTQIHFGKFLTRKMEAVNERTPVAERV